MGVPEEGTAAGLEIVRGGAGVREEEVTQKSPLTTRSTPSEPAGTHSLTNAFTFFLLFRSAFLSQKDGPRYRGNGTKCESLPEF